jgi:Tol biopolymer transport system component
MVIRKAIRPFIQEAGMWLHNKYGIVSYCKALLVALISGFPLIGLIGCASPSGPDYKLESINYSGLKGRIVFNRVYYRGPTPDPDFSTVPNYMVVVDGNQKTANMTRVYGHHAISSAALSPITDQIVFSASKDSGYDYSSLQLYTFDPNGAIRKFAVSDLNNFSPVFTEDGQWVFYRVNRVSDGVTCVYRIKPDGTANTILFASGLMMPIGKRISPSPDGTRITFSVNSSICTATIDGTGYKEIVKPGTNETFSDPCWSSLGGRIVFISNLGPLDRQGLPLSASILSVDTSGANLDTIYTGTRVLGSWPAWSPDDSLIAFSGYDTDAQGCAHIYVVDAHSHVVDVAGEPPKITSANSWDSAPCWVP